MQINDKFFYINIRDYLALGSDSKAGEPMLARVLSGFSCPKIAFLEAENEEKLLSFYRDNRFSQFDTRQTASDTDESHKLVQLLRLL